MGFFLSNRENMAVCKLFNDFTEMFDYYKLIDALLTHKAGPEGKWPNQVMVLRGNQRKADTQ